MHFTTKVVTTLKHGRSNSHNSKIEEKCAEQMNIIVTISIVPPLQKSSLNNSPDKLTSVNLIPFYTTGFV